MNTTLTSITRLLAREGLLADSANVFDEAGVNGSGGAERGVSADVCGVDCDSRHAAPGHLFVCKGNAFRASYLAQALAAGCVGYLCDEARAGELAALCPQVPRLVSHDLRRAMALVSAEAWGHPDRSLGVLGITGTKGKSTVAYMLRSILDSDADGTRGAPHTGILGSIETFDGIEREESVNTTPEAPDLWRHLHNAATSGLSHMVMEVSSQALKYDRVVGLGLDVACFLNIGCDHISPVEHPSFEDYFESKLRIFDQACVAVVNLDSDKADVILERAARCGRTVTFSATGQGAGGAPAGAGGADVWAEGISSREGRIQMMVRTPSWSEPVTVSMPGLFNADNALAAIAICEACGIGRERVVAGLARVRVPGRMELLPTADPKVTGIVDYAHNKLSYQRFFSSMAQEFAGRAIIAVLGAPGGKAYERRRELPQEASKWADYLIYTEEDPAGDPVEEICSQLAAATPAGQDFEVIVDRPAAIRRAVELAFGYPQGALVCLLAKGDETLQHVGNSFVPCETDGTLFERAVGERLG